MGEGHEGGRGTWPVQGGSQEQTWRRHGIVMGRAAGRLLACGLRAWGSAQRGSLPCGVRGAAAGTRAVEQPSDPGCVLRWHLLSPGCGVRGPAPRFGSEGRGQGPGLGRMVWLSCHGLCVRASVRTRLRPPQRQCDSHGPPGAATSASRWLCVVPAKNRAPGGRLGDASAGTPTRRRQVYLPTCPRMPLSGRPWGAPPTSALSRKVCSVGVSAPPPACPPLPSPLVT